MKTVLSTKTHAGTTIKATPGKTTTVLGRLDGGTQKVITELNYPHHMDFGSKDGGFNLLNMHDVDFDPKTFWDKFNKPFLDKAAERGDIIQLVSDPTKRTNIDRPSGGKTFLGKEVEYLTEKCCYVYNDDKTALFKP